MKQKIEKDDFSTSHGMHNGFYDVDGINVIILYPKGKVSEIQEKQLTTLDKNVFALEVDGTFDDCQKLVKKAFLDDKLNEQINLSSANSINIARLIPQSFYYAHSYLQSCHHACIQSFMRALMHACNHA